MKSNSVNFNKKIGKVSITINVCQNPEKFMGLKLDSHTFTSMELLDDGKGAELILSESVKFDEGVDILEYLKDFELRTMNKYNAKEFKKKSLFHDELIELGYE